MQRNVAIAAVVIMVGNVVSRLLGLVREQVMAWLFGATGATDAFVAASAVPMIVYDLLIGGAISAALVPVLVEKADDDAHLSEVLGALLTLAAVALLGVTAVLLLLAPSLMLILGGGFDAAQREQATGMVRVMLVAVLLQGLAGVLMAALYARKRFAAPAFAPALYNGAIIAGALVLHPMLGVESLAVGVVLGALGQLVLQAMALPGLRLRPSLGLHRPEVRQALRLYAPVAAGMIVTIIGIVIDRYLASLLEDGSMTIMSYATRLIQFPLGLVGVAISSAILPTLSEYAAAEPVDSETRWDAYRRGVVSGTRLIFFLMIPALVGIALLRDPLVQVMFERGRFSLDETARTSLVLLAYAPQLPFTALDQLLIVAFYARKDTRTPVLVGVVTVLVYLGAALLLIGPMGVTGLALANAIQNSAHGLILLVLLQRAVGAVVSGELGWFMVRLCGAGGAMALLLLIGLSMPQIGTLPAVITLAVLGGGAGILYLTVAKILRIEELDVLVSVVRRRGPRTGVASAP